MACGSKEADFWNVSRAVALAQWWVTDKTVHLMVEKLYSSVFMMSKGQWKKINLKSKRKGHNKVQERVGKGYRIWAEVFDVKRSLCTSQTGGSLEGLVLQISLGGKTKEI